MRDKRDTKKKRFIETLAAQGTVSHAAQAAGVSRNTAYRWRIEDREFAACWDDAHEKAVDAVESVLYQKALSGDTICMIFYLKAHRAIYRDKLNIDLKQVQSQIEDRIAQLRQRGDVLPLVIPSLTQ
jgi:transposase-like protein